MEEYKVLGMTLGHNATAAITKNGKIIACASEERFVRRKNVYGYPKKAIEFCLEYSKVNPEDLDLVVLSSHITPPLMETKDGLQEASPEGATKGNWFTTLSQIRNTLKKNKKLDTLAYRKLAPFLAKTTHKKRVEIISTLLGIDKEKIISSEHHLTHAYTGIFASGFSQKQKEKLLVITADGEGDMLSSSVGTFDPSTLEYSRIATSNYSESIGHFYSAITKQMGMKMLEHEYKVMGLAPYSESNISEELYKKFCGIIKINEKLQIKTKVHSHCFEETLEKLCKGVRFDYIATAAQKLVEKLLVDLVRKSVQTTGLSSVILSGGVFMNVKANYEILKLAGIKKVFIMPSCGDESLPIGSCYYGTLKHNKKLLETMSPLEKIYFGPEYSKEEIERELGKNEFKYKYFGKKIAQEIARLLAKGEVVARFGGRMEFGARSLGNRSIIADASNRDVVEEINKMIKMRDFWMPFAPSIMEEHAEKYIKNPELLKKVKSYFMMMAFESTPLAQKDLKAALHPYDKTLRPHMVNKKNNPEYYAILEAFMKKTGKFGILNTSFNIHGEPVACNPKDALHVLRDSGLKYVALGEFMAYK